MGRPGFCLPLVLGSLLVASCVPAGPPAGPGSPPEAAPAAPKRIRVAVLFDPVTVFPNVDLRQASSSEELENLVNAGLASIDRFRTLRPQLAEAVPSTENGLWKVFPDGKMETTWRIREGAHWHDGAPFTAEDILFTLQVVQDRDLPELKGREGRVLDSIESIEAPDRRTIVVRWKKLDIQADAVFNGRVAMPMPEHILEGPYLNSKESFLQLPYWNEAHVGTGPFKLREFVRGSHVILDAFEGYILGRPRIDEVEVKFILDQRTVAANLLAGSVEATLGRGISIEQALEIRSQWKDGSIAEMGLPSWVRLHPQFIDANPSVVTELAFRRALLHAIDRQQMADTIQGGLVPVAHYIPSPSYPEYPELEPAMVKYNYDPRRSMQLLESIGLTRGRDGDVRDRSGRRIAVELRTTEVLDIQTKSLFAVADFWQRVGVRVEPLIIPRALQGDREYRATFPAFDIRRGPADLSQLGFHSAGARLPENSFRGAGSSDNIPRYTNPDMDGLVERFVVAIPRAERLEIARQIVHHVTENLVIFGLIYDAEPTMVGKRLKNFQGAVWNAHKWDATG